MSSDRRPDLVKRLMLAATAGSWDVPAQGLTRPPIGPLPRRSS